MLSILAFSTAVLMAMGHTSAAKPFAYVANSAFTRMNARQAQLIRAYNLAGYQRYHWSQKDVNFCFRTTDASR